MASLIASADREPGTVTADFLVPERRRGLLLNVNYTAEGGATATLDVKLQYRDGSDSTWEDLPGASVAQLAAVGEIDLMVYPGIAAIANRQVSIGIPKILRCVAVVGTDNLTYDIGVQFLE